MYEHKNQNFNTDWYSFGYSQYHDLDGNPVEKTRDKYPYSYDPYVTYQCNYKKGENHVVYSDRLWQWDYNKYDKCCMEVWGNRGQYFSNRSVKDIEKFLSLYFEKEVSLTALMEGCNVSNGYPYWIFFYKDKN
jgi:hypothetical protein